jgi:signal transduction histidine kinase
VRLDDLAREQPGVEVVAPRPVAVRGDAVALEWALQNLVDNARRHGSGRVRVEAGETGSLAWLAVEDEGPGVDAEEAERVFGRFQRGRAAGTGSGLGLALVRATAERHGGRASAAGARFTIELPRLRDVSESAATTASEREKGSP